MAPTLPDGGATVNREADPRWRLYARTAIAFSLCAFAFGLALVPRASTGAAVAASDPMIAAAGDIACDPGNSNYNGGSGKNGNCQQKATAALLNSSTYAAVLPLGDNQYYCGSYTEFSQSYANSWGTSALYPITHPVVGNHEYITHSDSSGSAGCDSSNSGASGYFRYFGSKAGDKGHGFYSYNIGAWHLIALNSNCGDAGGCGSGSAQYNFLKNDLATHSNACTLAYWHIPLFSSGGRAASNSKPFWDLLYQYDADVILNGHDHIYERFAPQTPSASADNSRGIREFIVGTGGANHTSLASTARNSQIRNSSTFGILQLTLHPTSYDWRFVPAGGSFSDSGSQACHGGGSTGGDTTAPSVPTNLHGSAPSANEVDLSWNASSDNVGVAGYYVFRNGAQIGQSGSTSYTDTTVSGSTTYSYTVKAFDAAGNQSGSSNTATITTPSGGGGSGSLTFTPIDDSYVFFDQPDASFGGDSTIQVDNSPVKHFLMKFSVTGVGTKTVTNATLRLYCVNSSPMGGEYRSVSTNDWTEGTVTWNNAPSFGSAVATLGSVSAGNWYTVNVTSLVHGDGTVSIGVTSTNSDGADYTSSEGSSSFVPQLVVTTN
jgi:chitodextrinase